MKKWVIFILVLAIAGLTLVVLRNRDSPLTPREVAEKTWEGFKYSFIESDGRVKRIEQGDTVSEGQAYAMLRAVWMGDKAFFDKCYHWSEENLSRLRSQGDHLLAWQWKEGKVADWMPASDADIDYALSLIFAHAQWGNGTTNYTSKARNILADILRLETFRLPNGRLYLAPWILENVSDGLYPQNPSYYSPAHFKIFYEFTGDKRWLELVDTSYVVLSSLSERIEDHRGVGLIPDWVKINSQGEFVLWQEKSSDFGWDAVRFVYRVGIDYLWFGEERAKSLLEKTADFLETQWRAKKILLAGYAYSGESINHYESPLFYAAYDTVLKITGSKIQPAVKNKLRGFLNIKDQHMFYLEQGNYYINSLSWLSDGLDASLIRNLYRKEGDKGL